MPPPALRLWTIQPAERWRRACCAGLLRGTPPQRDDPWRAAYLWMADRMHSAGLEGADGGILWAWFRYPGKPHGRPDLREGALLPRGTEGVRIRFTLPAAEVLLSDFDAWHHVLNYWYLPKDIADEQRFERCVSARGEDFHRTKPLRSSELHEQIVASWERIFVGVDASAGAIQATFVELPCTRVERVEPFLAR